MKKDIEKNNNYNYRVELETRAVMELPARVPVSLRPAGLEPNRLGAYKNMRRKRCANGRAPLFLPGTVLLSRR